MIFGIGLLVGIYSYIIFALGLLGFLYKELLLGITAIYILIIFVKFKNLLPKINIKKLIELISKKDKLSKLVIFLIIIQAFVNFLGALGPELGFDALWYHLTIPKIYLANNSIFHIPGGLYYYSGLPKLTEMVYLGVLANDTFSKLFHFSFGLLALTALYKLSRNFLSEKLSLLVVLVFYSSLVVGWQSITAYVDLARTFFEIMALWGFVNWVKERKQVWLFESAVMLGLAISTKILSLGTLAVFLSILIYILWSSGKLKILWKKVVLYLLITFIIPLPYFIFNLLNSGNLFYPIFSQFYNVNFNFSIINPLRLSDPISPLFFIFLPFVLFYFKKFNRLEKLLTVFAALSFIVWYFTPQTGGGRFLLPYLPIFSLVTVFSIKFVYRYRNLWNLSMGLIILVSVISILYRGAANLKYIPVVLGIQSRDQFLSNNLNFSYGDFYDTDGYFRSHIKDSDKVLLFGFHNLYYANFPFIHSSYIKKGDRFNYIATQNKEIPDRFKFWNLVYSNPRTGVNLYSLGGQEWTY